MQQNTRRVSVSWVIWTMTVAVLAMNSITGHAAETTLVVNPYEHVDWQHHRHHKANLHTHTTESDGRLSPAAVLDLYNEHGYAALALTDHDRCTWPWEQYDRDAATLGMTAIPGNELSRHHHVLSLFCDYETEEEDLDAAVAGVAEAGGIAILCHPAMHWEPQHSNASRLRRFLDEDARPQEAPSAVVDDYVALFKRHPHLVATEVSNASEPLYRYPMDRRLWDQLLTAMMPERPVWGVNTDDMHTMDHFGLEYVVFVTGNREIETLREALVTGAFYFTSRRVPDTAPTASTQPPQIVSIEHDTTKHTITVQAAMQDRALPDAAYVWISDGEPVHTGPSLSYRTNNGLGGYARLEITAESGVTFTNPFGFATAP